MMLGLVFFQFSFGQEVGNQLYQNSKNRELKKINIFTLSHPMEI